MGIKALTLLLFHQVHRSCRKKGRNIRLYDFVNNSRHKTTNNCHRDSKSLLSDRYNERYKLIEPCFIFFYTYISLTSEACNMASANIYMSAFHCIWRQSFNYIMVYLHVEQWSFCNRVHYNINVPWYKSGRVPFAIIITSFLRSYASK